MQMIKKIKDYIKDDEFRMTIFKDRVHIINYYKIISVGREKIIISSKEEKVYFHGSDFSLNKLFAGELLIEGTIHKVEIFYE